MHPRGHSAAQTHKKPIAPASRLPAFHSQTRNGTVIGRFPRPRGKANSVSPLPARIAPPRWGNAQAVDAIVPCPRKKRAIPGTCLAGQLHLARELPRFLLRSGTSLPRPCPKHTTGGVLANLSKIARKVGCVNESPIIKGSRFHFPRLGACEPSTCLPRAPLLPSQSRRRACTGSARQPPPLRDCA